MTACWSSMSHSAMGNLESTVQNNALRLLMFRLLARQHLHCVLQVVPVGIEFSFQWRNT